MVRLCRIWSAARVEANWFDAKGTSTLTITNLRDGIMQSFVLASESNTLRKMWKQTILELSTEMVWDF